MITDFDEIPIIVVQERIYDNAERLDSMMIFPKLHSERFEDREFTGFASSWRHTAEQ